MPNDPKWRTIARHSKQPISLVQATFLHLMVEASRNVTRGHADVTAEDLASALDCDEDQIQAILDAMQGRVLDGMQLAGWEKRQPKREEAADGESSAKSAAERKRAQREREKLAQNEDVSREVTAASREVTTDKDKDKEKNTPQPPKGCERPDSAAESEGFTEFWSVYPRKVGKDAARKAFAKRKPDPELLAKMLAAVAIQAKSAQWQRDGGQYIPHPSTWLNEGRWDDGEGAAQGGDSESRPQWALQAGFENRWEAENERCYAHNAHLFRDGRRMEVPD
ncbi:hypothetical protein [Delftia acidovorans]|uniref:hypothetical protein n=1 Tax=Delftia acidovorans TaxID=80866 RepID=UPI00333EB83D